MSGPLLTTARYELWQPEADDLADLFDLTLAEETRRFLGSFVPSQMDAFNRLHRNAGSWALWGYGTFMVREKGGAKIIGNCGVFRSHRGFGDSQGMDNVAEAGWIVHKDHWGKGLAGEVMQAALGWFDDVHGRQRIVCMIEQGHAASDGLARKLGFVPYGLQESDGVAPIVLYQRLPA